MRRTASLAVLALATALAPAGRAVATNAWLKIPGIQGESLEPGRTGDIEVDSMQISTLQGMARAAGGGGGAGKVSLHDFHFTKKVDKASAKLMQAAAKGVHIPRVTLTCRKAGGGQQEYLVITMKDVLISSYQTGGSARGGGAVPTDSFTLVASDAEFQTVGSPSRASATGALAAPAVVHVAPTPAPVPKITGASASAPPIGLAVTVPGTSTGPCQNAFVDYGDGSIAEGHALTGTTTALPAHPYATAGAKTIKVGGRDAPYWPQSPQKAPPPANANNCTGFAPVVHVTLRSAAVESAPALRK